MGIISNNVQMRHYANAKYRKMELNKPAKLTGGTEKKYCVLFALKQFIRTSTNMVQFLIQNGNKKNFSFPFDTRSVEKSCPLASIVRGAYRFCARSYVAKVNEYIILNENGILSPFGNFSSSPSSSLPFCARTTKSGRLHEPHHACSILHK